MFKRYLSLVLLLFFPVSSMACWTAKERSEIDGFAELDDILILSFKDAIDCKPVSNAQVMIGDTQYEADARGYLKLPMEPFSSRMDAKAAIKISKQGYITLATDLIVEAGTVLNRKMVLSPALPPGKVRFVLSWNSEPEDLDLHLKGPGFHISYRNMKNAPNKANLDQDEREGYGPETITLDRITNASYGLWVDNFSDDESFQGSEQVFVYSGDRLIKKIQLPRTSQRAVKILEIRQGNFEFINLPSSRP